MTPGGWIFMSLSCVFITLLALFSFWKILTKK